MTDEEIAKLDVKFRGVPIKDMSLSKLQLAALKAYPSSPIQKAIQKEIDQRILKGEKVWLPPPSASKCTRKKGLHA